MPRRGGPLLRFADHKAMVGEDRLQNLSGATGTVMGEPIPRDPFFSDHQEWILSVSVIIPTLNEESCLRDTLVLLQQHRPHEIIVVDGGSSDATCRLASAADLLLHGPRGRAAQMNLGAAHATGDVLLFLHADCSLEEGALRNAERLLGRRGIIAGCCTMTVRAHGWLYRWIDTCATARIRLTGLVYGDQGLFLHRESFR